MTCLSSSPLCKGGQRLGQIDGADMGVRCQQLYFAHDCRVQVQGTRFSLQAYK